MSPSRPAPTLAQRSFFGELSRLLQTMREEPLSKVEAAIENRFRALLRDEGGRTAGALRITLTWGLPEGAEGWAYYQTDCECETDPAACEEGEPTSGVADNVFAFPDSVWMRAADDAA